MQSIVLWGLKVGAVGDTLAVSVTLCVLLGAVVDAVLVMAVEAALAVTVSETALEVLVA